MARLVSIFLSAILLLGLQQPIANAQLSDLDKDEVRDIVREYIIANPEIIGDALIELQRRMMQQEISDLYIAVENNHAAIYDDPRDSRTGPVDAEIVIVEFIDYKCSFCRAASEWVSRVRETHGDRVRFIFKEYPILGPDSLEAARAAIAARRQGEAEYERLHTAMVSASGPLPGRRIDQLAFVAGVDVEQMRRDMADIEIASQISDTRRLGAMMGVTGTPFFIIEGVIVQGANEMLLEDALQQALSR